MPLFRRDKRPDVGILLLQGEDMIDQLARAHISWGLDTAQRWGLDQTTGLITWTFDDKTATAPAQILGSHNSSAGSWLWSWANKTVLPGLTRDAVALREWGEKNGQRAFVQPKIVADDAVVATLTALAVRVSGATGFYRGPGGTNTVFITFGAVTLQTSNGETSTFEIAIS